MFRNVSVFVVIIMAVAGCNSSDSSMVVPDHIVNKSLEWFDGKVLNLEKGQEGAEELWKVRVQNKQGAVVEFSWLQSDGNLYRIDGMKGPFDDNYDLFPIVPGQNLVNFKSVKFAATSQLKNDNLQDWILGEESSFYGLWIYSLNYNENGKSIIVFVNATSGEVLEIE